MFLGFPCGSAGEESARNVGDLGSVPGLGRSPGEGKGYPLQYSGLGNSMNCVVHGVTKSWTRLSDFHCVSVVLKFWEWGVMELWVKAMDHHLRKMHKGIDMEKFAFFFRTFQTPSQAHSSAGPNWIPGLQIKNSCCRWWMLIDS